MGEKISDDGIEDRCERGNAKLQIVNDFNQNSVGGFRECPHHMHTFGESLEMIETDLDFVAVDDVVAVNLWFLQHPEQSGIYNLGTGRAQPFNDVAVAAVNAARALKGEAALPLAMLVQGGQIEYIPFPDALVGKYQSFTEADLTQLRATGCQHRFADVAAGVKAYMGWLAQQS